jgi:hypothetical protein
LSHGAGERGVPRNAGYDAHFWGRIRPVHVIRVADIRAAAIIPMATAMTAAGMKPREWPATMPAGLANGGPARYRYG